MLCESIFAVAFVEHAHVVRPGAGGDLAGIRWRVEACFSVVDCTGRGDASGKIRMAPCGRSPFHQRSVHAHRDGEFLPVERYRPQDARWPQTGHGKNGYV